MVIPIDKILMHVKDDHYLKWIRPLHSSPNAHDKKKYYNFHKDHDHYTEDYRDLKEQIKELIQKGKLQKFVKKGEYSQLSTKRDRRDKDDHRKVVHRWIL